jgi:Spy/CpxP family protein refolding chaperone
MDVSIRRFSFGGGRSGGSDPSDNLSRGIRRFSMMRHIAVFTLVPGLLLFGASFAAAADDGAALPFRIEQVRGKGGMAADPGMGPGMGPGQGMGRHSGMHGNCPKMGGGRMRGDCPKMAGGMRGRGAGMARGGPSAGKGDGLAGSLHRWFAGLMAARSRIGLTDEQETKLDDAMTAHRKFAVRKQAEIRTTEIDLAQVLRRKPLDLARAEALIRQVATLQGELRIEGIQLYDTVWNMLSEAQRASAISRIGGPFPDPWESDDAEDDADETEEDHSDRDEDSGDGGHEGHGASSGSAT